MVLVSSWREEATKETHAVRYYTEKPTANTQGNTARLGGAEVLFFVSPLER